MLQHFEKVIPSVKSLLSSLKMRYIVSVVALLETCGVNKHGRHLGLHLGITNN